MISTVWVFMNLVTGLIIDSIQTQKQLAIEEEERLKEAENSQNIAPIKEEKSQLLTSDENSNIHEILSDIMEKIQLIESKMNIDA
jgi:hypothetical protein